MRSALSIGLVIPLLLLAACQASRADRIDLSSGRYDTSTLHREDLPSELAVSDRLLRVIPVDEAADDATYVYEVSARSLAEIASKLRIQAVWLPEGGWDATDENGESLTRLEVTRVEPQPGAAGSWDLQFKRPAHAVELRIFLVNEGEAPIEVSSVSVIEATRKQEGATG